MLCSPTSFPEPVPLSPLVLVLIQSVPEGWPSAPSSLLCASAAGHGLASPAAGLLLCLLQTPKGRGGLQPAVLGEL